MSFVACNLDWNVRPDPVDGGTIVGRDASDERSSGGRDAGADGPSMVTDADTGVGVDCAALTAELDDRRKTARRCSFQVGECLESVKDACDCDVVIGRSGSAETSAYASSVARLKESGCPLGCGACPATTPRNCLSKATGVIECFPP
jgi:hypothetical protein